MGRASSSPASAEGGHLLDPELLQLLPEGELAMHTPGRDEEGTGDAPSPPLGSWVFEFEWVWPQSSHQLH